jgi:hypothetical protein
MNFISYAQSIANIPNITYNIHAISISIFYPGLRTELARPEGQVWFAGEATLESSLLSSSVRGAWGSGAAAAAGVCRALGVPVLTPVSF